MTLLQAWKESLSSYLAEDFKPLSVLKRTYELWLRTWWWLVAFEVINRLWVVVYGEDLLHELTRDVGVYVVSVFFIGLVGLFALCTSAYDAVVGHKESFTIKRFVTLSCMVAILFLLLFGIGFLSFKYNFFKSFIDNDVVSVLLMYRDRCPGMPLILFSVFFFLYFSSTRSFNVKFFYQSLVKSVHLWVYTYPAVLLGWLVLYLPYAVNNYLYYSYGYYIISESWRTTTAIAVTIHFFIEKGILYPLYISFWFAFCQKNKKLIGE